MKYIIWKSIFNRQDFLNCRLSVALEFVSEQLLPVHNDSNCSKHHVIVTIMNQAPTDLNETSLLATKLRHEGALLIGVCVGFSLQHSDDIFDRLFIAESVIYLNDMMQQIAFSACSK